MEQMILWFELHQLQQQYISALDNDRLEQWADFFTEECIYEIVPRENEDAGLPIGIIYCDSKRMLRDRVLSLRHANIYEVHSYRHMTSGMQIRVIDADTVETESSYVVVRTPDGWRYKAKRVIYDTSRVATLLATPI